MTQITVQYQWYFPGGWYGLALAGIIGLILVMISYRYTVHTFKWYLKIPLVLLRTLFLAMLLLCLCNPVRLKKKQKEVESLPEVAVIVDNSGSMRVPGYWRKTRLDEAITWVESLRAGSRKRCNIKLFEFAEELKPIEKTGDLKSGSAKLKTKLFDNLSKWTGQMADEKFKAAIWITDGVDTAGGDRNTAIGSLAASPLPQLFLPATLKLPHPPEIGFEQVSCQSLTKPRSVVPVTVIVRKSGKIAGHELKLVVICDNIVTLDKSIPVKGSGIEYHTVKLNIEIGEEGVHHCEALLSAKGFKTEKIKWIVTAASNTEARKILLFQGRLTFDQAYLRRIFAGDKRGSLTVRFARDVFGSHQPNRMSKELGFPDYRELRKYNVVILNALKRSQVTPQMEQDLKKFLRNGGSLLFMTVNSRIAAGYAFSGLEKLLPVIFEKPGDTDKLDAATSLFVRQMRQYHQGRNRKNSDGSVKFPPLRNFRITREGKASRIFTMRAKTGEDREIVPQFHETALIRKLKPGAVCLAVAGNLERKNGSWPLLAVQNYSRGRTAVLATDGLWRWKLAIPSSDDSYQVFWRNLLLWLSAGSQSKPAWILNSWIFPSGKPAKLRFRIPTGMSLDADRLKYEAVDTKTGKAVPVRMTRDRKQGEYWSGELKTDPGRAYLLKASENGVIVAEAMINISGKVDDPEFSKVVPDLPILRELASAAGNKLLDPGEAKINWDNILPPVKTRTVDTIIDYLWHRPWIFLIILAAYLLELILRRNRDLV